MEPQKIRHSSRDTKIEKNVWDSSCIAMNTWIVMNGACENEARRSQWCGLKQLMKIFEFGGMKKSVTLTVTLT